MFLALFASLFLIEGIHKNEPMTETPFWLARYLPYNPKIAILSERENPYAHYSLCWPNAIYTSENADLIWVDANGAELFLLEKNASLLENSKVVYTSTHFFSKGTNFAKLKQLLASFHFSLVTHWYRENIEGMAIFVKNEILEGEKKGLIYSPHQEEPTPPLAFESFLRPITNKANHHKIDAIDFIYMINLDERPEKFESATSALNLYGIYPYRFSAVNGWNLPLSTINSLGLQLSSNTILETAVPLEVDHSQKEPAIPNSNDSDAKDCINLPSPTAVSRMMGTCFYEGKTGIQESNEFIHEGNSFYSFGFKLGAIGIILSHLSVLQDAYDANYETIWVMEDDVEVLGDASQISNLIAELDTLTDSWDILFTDPDTKNTQGVYVPCRALAPRPNLHVKPLDFFYEQSYPINKNFNRTGMRYGAYSMIIRRSGIEKILQFYQKYRVFLPYDIDFWISGEMEMYCLSQDLISHKAFSPSDNRHPLYKNKSKQND